MIVPRIAKSQLTPSPQFDDSDSSNSSSDNLPFPKPLARSAFLTEDFNPNDFLSTLHNRHQTLEDLRTELRTRSSDINKELLDLVNENYQDFLSLGSSLKGGDEKVEEVRFGLLSFRKEVEGLKGKVVEREDEVKGLVGEKRRIREEVQIGRRLLEVDSKIEDLEQRLMLVSAGLEKVNGAQDGRSESEGESDEDGDEDDVAIPRLRRHVEQYIYVTRSIEKIGGDHPFLVKQEDRVLRLKQTILLDLNTALKQAVAEGDVSRDDLLELLDLYNQMDQAQEAVTVLRESKSKR